MTATQQVALVTGSGKRRVGSYVADALADRGYSLVLHYRSSAAEAEASVARYQARGIPARAIPADLTDEKAVERLVSQSLEAFGRLDVLVNCAAIWQRKRLEDVTAADVRLHLETNALATFLCAQQARPGHGEAAGRAASSSISAIGPEVRPYLNYAAYFPSKGAVTVLTRSLAVELGTRNPNVRVNCILPGPVMLPLDLPEDRAPPGHQRHSRQARRHRRRTSPRPCCS